MKWYDELNWIRTGWWSIININWVFGNWSGASFLQQLLWNRVHLFLAWRNDLPWNFRVSEDAWESYNSEKSRNRNIYRRYKLSIIGTSKFAIEVKNRGSFLILQVDRTISQSNLMNDERTWTFCIIEWAALFLCDGAKRMCPRRFMRDFFSHHEL